MAQTIAVQRGTTSVTADGVSRVTLFTQSSGTATRVILVGLSMNMPSGTGIRIAMSLTVNVNGTGNYLPIALISGNNGTSGRYLNMFPNAASNSSGSTFAPASAHSNSSTIMSTNDGGNALTANVANTQIALPGNVTNNGSSDPINYVPSQFWMANNDSVSLLCYATSGYSANIIYHFVTVTES